MAAWRTDFLITAFAVIVLGSLMITALKWRIVLLMRKDNPARALIQAGFLPWLTPFRLVDDGHIDPKLLRLAQLHDRLQKWLIWFMGLAMLVVALVVTFQEDKPGS